MTKSFLKSWRSLASAVVLIAAANACGSGTISGGGDKTVAGLRFTSQPTASGAAGAQFSLAVELLDASGAKISNADDPVTLSVNGGADLLGTLTHNAVGGVATFPGLSVTRAGTGYTITATANGIPSSSSSFTVTPAAANAGQSGATYNPTTITTGATIAVVFTFKDQYGNPIPNKSVTLSSNLAGVTFTPSTGTTSATGTFTTNLVATAAGSATVSATVDGVAISLPTAVTIAAPVTFTITTSSNPTTGGTTSGGGTVSQGASVTVVAAPAAGFTFTNWTESGTAVSTSASFNFTVTANRVLVANFTASVPCNPIALTFPGTAAGSVTAGTGCTSGTAPASIYQFSIAAQGGASFAVTSTGFADPAIAVLTEPAGTAQVGWFSNASAITQEWILPAGTYRLRVSSNSGGTGAFSVTGTSTPATSNNGSGCAAGVPLRSFVVGGTYTGQTLSAADCQFTGNIPVDVFFIRSTKPCTIRMAPTGFDAMIQARNLALTGTLAIADDFDVGGAEQISLNSCSDNGSTIAIMASAFNPNEAGSYTLTITITGGGSLMAGNLSALQPSALGNLGPMNLGDVFRSSVKERK